MDDLDKEIRELELARDTISKVLEEKYKQKDRNDINKSLNLIAFNVFSEFLVKKDEYSLGAVEVLEQSLELCKHNSKILKSIKKTYKSVFFDFSESERNVKIDGKKPIKMGIRGTNQKFVILEELLVKESVHWTAGFKIFKEWQNGFPKRTAKIQFGKPISELNNFLPEYFPDEIVEYSNHRKYKIWELNQAYDIKSSIKNSNDVLEDLEKIKIPDKIIEKVEEAFKSYPESLEVGKTIIKFFGESKNKIHFNKLSQKVDMNYILDNFRTTELNLIAANKMISKKSNIKRFNNDLEEANYFKIEMIKELNKIQSHTHSLQKLNNNLPLDDDERQCFAIKTKIHNIKTLMNQDETLKVINDDEDLQEWTNLAIIRLIKWYKNKYSDDLTLEAIKNYHINFEGCTYEVIRDGKFNKKTISELKNYFIKFLYLNMRKELLENKISIENTE